MSDKDYLIKGEMYQYNLGWLIQELLSFKQDLATAIDLKTIKYADPIQWDITTQYPANTVVVDPKSGTAYMSKVPVPAGVELKNTNYWVVVFNYQDIYNKIMDGVAFNDRDQDYATKDLLVNDLVWYAGDLYRATREIPTGSKYIPGTNLIKTSIESLLARYYGRDRTAQISNDTVNVSGDYTLVAGDIAETASNVTLHSTRDMLLDSDGKLTEQITGDREIDVDGNDSVHIDGASTVNVGGLRTEVYAGDKTVGVTGTYTERSATKIVDASTETHNADTFNITKNLKYKTPVPVNDFYDNVPFIGQDGNIYNLMSATANTEGIIADLLNNMNDSAQINKALLDKLKSGANVYMIGDSIGEGWGWWGKQGVPKTVLNDGFFALMRPIFPNTNFINRSVSAAHFNQTITDNTVQAQAAGINNADVVFILAGINDITLTVDNDADYLGVIKNNVFDNGFSDFDTTKALGAMENIIKTIYEQNPDAYVCYILTGTTGGIDIDRYYGFYDNYIDVCNKWGVSVFNCVNHIGSYPDPQARKYYADYFHYNEDGYKKLAPYLIKALLTQTNENNYIGKSLRTYSSELENMVPEIAKRMGLWNNSIFTTFNRIKTNTSKWFPAMLWSEGDQKIIWSYDPYKGVINNQTLNSNGNIVKASAILTGQTEWNTPPLSMLDLMPNGISIIPNTYLANVKGLPAELKSASASSGDLIVISMQRRDARHVFCMLAFGQDLYHGIIPSSGNSIFQKISGFTAVDGSPV